ncbi:MAG: hypothetical protein BMS9Abin19_0773 [Gammaproteobacteria bacterium]|nr:MAG: hypothetical protein BMS9Abin19_0773 [Gammaproteobacteria bacterium]
MNRLLTKNAMKINGLFTKNTAKNTARNTTSATLLAALFLSVFSTSTFANRPAMEDSSEVTTEPETQTQTEQATAQTRPQAEAPSAVEVMMQHQSQQPRQTGDVVQLPATEMQPGETLSIHLLDYPRRGMSMEKVQQEYGQPMATSESVGQPPITHWTYNDRIVYFEYSTVLHVVAR